MMPVKIECECGQHYAFEIEPMDGKMPLPVACPNCGTDGTAQANSIISSRLLSTDPIPPPDPEPKPERSSIIASSIRRDMRLGLVDRKQAEHEARAKMMWGDSMEQVISYLMIQGFSHPEASNLAENLFRERSSSVRASGFRKIIIGAALICVPIFATLVFLSMGVFMLRLFGISIAVGVYGAWLVINGLLMAAAPRSEIGDISRK
jgi:hypothetical protein